MADLVNTGNKNTLLDNNLLISSESSPTQRVMVVDPVANKIAINKTTPTVELDIVGSTSISSALTVQTSKLIVDSSGRVGINVVPSGLYQLEVSGDVSIIGNVTLTGSTVFFNTTTTEIQDSNITINKNGSDASANGAGLTIDRNPSADALLIWNNTKTNFEAGVVGNVSSLIRAGGNTDAAAITIGTNDNFDFNLKTNNSNRVQIASAGGVTINTNTTITGSVLLGSGASQTRVEDTLVPPGTIIAFIPGTFSSAGNVGFSPTLTTNNIASVNAWLIANGYDQWRVCDGQTYTIAGSPLYSSARAVPDLDDERFLAGSTTSASAGGTNSGSHTHSTPNALTGIQVSHHHPINTAASGPGTILSSGAGTSGSASPNSTGPGSGGTGGTSPSLGALGLSHSHGGSHPHYHPFGSYRIGYTIIPSIGNVRTFIGMQFVASPSYPVTVQVTAPADGASCSINYNWVEANGCTGSTSASIGPALSSVARDHSHGVSSHTHPLASHTHSIASHNHSNGSHTHPSSSTTWSTTPSSAFNSQFSHSHTTNTQSAGTENRPQYLSVFYLVRVK